MFNVLYSYMINVNTNGYKVHINMSSRYITLTLTLYINHVAARNITVLLHNTNVYIQGYMHVNTPTLHVLSSTNIICYMYFPP